MQGEILYNVPIFPLHTVLFPGMPLPLQIFEDRYLQMIEDLGHRDNRFCVAHIVEGQEVGGSAEPARVGCLGEIVDLKPLPGGRFFIIVVGVERVRILSTDGLSKPYLTGSLELLPDDDAGPDIRLVEKARGLFEQYLACLVKLSGDEGRKIPVPSEPDLLSYMLGTALQVETVVRQGLLEMPGCAERLKAEVEIMQLELPVLRSLLSGSSTPAAGYGKFSAN